MSAISLSAYYLHSHETMPADEHVIVGVNVTPIASNMPRRAFHLALLLDTSGSMEGPRMEALKRTLHLLIDALDAADRLTIIEYEAEACSLATARQMIPTNRTDLHRIVDTLTANGGTNLEAGLALLRETDQTSAIDSVFILTDGHINVGLSSTNALQRLLTSAVRSGTPVNTLGYGSDHNSRFLRDMALRSCGTYTYADADELLPAIIGDITGGLAAEVGRSATLTIPEGWTCLEVGATSGASSYTIGTLIADKTQWVILKGPKASDFQVMETIRCDFVSNGVSYTQYVSPRDVNTIAVALQRDRVRVASVFSSVTTHMEEGRYAVAKAALVALAEELDASEAAQETFAIRLRGQVDEMLETLESYIIAPPLHNGFASMVSRLASNTAALGNQRGFFTTGRPVEDPADNATFSSPLQRLTSGAMTQRYVSVTHDPESTEYEG